MVNAKLGGDKYKLLTTWPGFESYKPATLEPGVELIQPFSLKLEWYLDCPFE